MAKPVNVKKVIVTHPVTGTERKFDAAIYEPFKAAILQSLKDSKARLTSKNKNSVSGQGKTFTELADDVVKIIKKKMPDFKKSIPWYTISIRLDLETKGVVETFVEKGIKLNRLKK